MDKKKKRKYDGSKLIDLYWDLKDILDRIYDIDNKHADIVGFQEMMLQVEEDIDRAAHLLFYKGAEIKKKETEKGLKELEEDDI